MICPEMKIREIPANTSNFSRFTSLNKFPKKILNDQFEFAWKMRELAPSQHFSAFLEVWELLARTAEITTGFQKSSDWYGVIRVDITWAKKFSGVMENPKSLMRMYIKRFAEAWPIFDVTELEQRGLLKVEGASREAVISTYRSKGNESHSPECWLRHLDEASTPLPDWEHALSAWNQIRLNFFKDPHWLNTENSERIVSNAFLSLIYFFKESKLYFENPSLKPDIFDRTQVLSSL
jgi:hypothetical protein